MPQFPDKSTYSSLTSGGNNNDLRFYTFSLLLNLYLGWFAAIDSNLYVPSKTSLVNYSALSNASISETIPGKPIDYIFVLNKAICFKMFTFFL